MNGNNNKEDDIMPDGQNKKSPKDFLTDRAIRFFNRFGDELTFISQLLEIKLKQLALAYTVENNLPVESIHVQSRVKTFKSFLRKLEKKGWPKFYLPSEVVTDLIGARVICWFLDDCYGMLDYIKKSRQFMVRQKSIEDYISNPKKSGYRSIHVLVDVVYDRIKKTAEKRFIVGDKMVCEIQIRTMLQDAWGEFTHEMHYKVPEKFSADYKTLVTEIANRLASEDVSALAIRNILQKKIDKHEGYKEKVEKNNRAKK